MDKNELFIDKTLAGQARREVLRAMTQPITATQLSRKLRLSFDRCSDALLVLQKYKFVRCLNPAATRNHLFWLTKQGKDTQKHLGSFNLSHDFPEMDWELYASVCFNHRSEVIKTLTHPMQPSQIKRRATFYNPGLKMSSNNARDAMRYLKAHGIVQAIKLKKKAHPGYELTEVGQHIRRLLLQAEVRA